MVFREKQGLVHMFTSCLELLMVKQLIKKYTWKKNYFSAFCNYSENDKMLQFVQLLLTYIHSFVYNYYLFINLL